MKPVLNQLIELQASLAQEVEVVWLEFKKQLALQRLRRRWLRTLQLVVARLLLWVSAFRRAELVRQLEPGKTEPWPQGNGPVEREKLWR